MHHPGFRHPPLDDAMAELNVNGRVLKHDAESDTPLLWVLREQLGLTGGRACLPAVAARQRNARQKLPSLLIFGRIRGI